MPDVYRMTHLCLSYTIFIHLHKHDLQMRNKLIAQLGAYYNAQVYVCDDAILLKLMRVSLKSRSCTFMKLLFRPIVWEVMILISLFHLTFSIKYFYAKQASRFSFFV